MSDAARAAAVRGRVLLGLALLVQALGSGAALLIARRAWQTIHTPAVGPAPPYTLDVTGRSVDAASTALALVALAGVVAVLATRGIVRRAVGGVVVLAGLGLVWRAVTASSAVSPARARSLVAGQRRTVSVADIVPSVSTHGVWPVLSAGCGVVVLLAGVAVAWRGHRWQVMSARYEAPNGDQEAATAGRRPAGTDDDPEQARAKAATALWTALDRGEDPTD